MHISLKCTVTVTICYHFTILVFLQCMQWSDGISGSEPKTVTKNFQWLSLTACYRFHHVTVVISVADSDCQCSYILVTATKYFQWCSLTATDFTKFFYSVNCWCMCMRLPIVWVASCKQSFTSENFFTAAGHRVSATAWRATKVYANLVAIQWVLVKHWPSGRIFNIIQHW